MSSGAVLRVARILSVALFAAVSAQLAVRLPFTPVPVTLQTLVVVLAGITLGPRDGFLAMLSYLALGISGAPVFAGLSFGPAVLAGPTGGYLVAFPAAALVSGFIAGRLGRGRIAVLFASLGGSAIILTFGALHLSLIYGLTLAAISSIAVVPFIAVELVKAAVAAAVAGR